MLVRSAPESYNQHVATIYLGGTFGCVGTPLSPLNNRLFFPLLAQHVQENHQLTLYNVMPDLPVLDSSQLTMSHLSKLVSTIATVIEHGYREILIIQGTDTASYSASLVAYLFTQADVKIIFLASMQPLLSQPTCSSAQHNTYNINTHSDAFLNFELALNYYSEHTRTPSNTNVWLTSNELIPAINTQKIHKTGAPAFKASVFSEQKPQKTPNYQAIAKHIENIRIATLFCVPNNINNIETDLAETIAQQPNALILIGYGAGNFPMSTKIKLLLQQAYTKNIVVVIASQAVFGNVTADYAAGSWLHDCHVLSSKSLTLPSLFARLCYFLTTMHSVQSIHKHW